MASQNVINKNKVKSLKTKIKKTAWALLYPEEAAEAERAEAAALRGPLPGNVSGVLKSAEWRPIFEEWLRADDLGAYVDFISDVELYENNAATPQNLVAIVNQYIVDGAPQHVNVGEAYIVDPLVAAAANPPQAPDPDLFFRAVREVKDNMLESSFGDFHAKYKD